MTNIMLLTDEDVRPIQQLVKLLMRRISVMKQIKHSIKSHRYELVRGEDAELYRLHHQTRLNWID